MFCYVIGHLESIAECKNIALTKFAIFIHVQTMLVDENALREQERKGTYHSSQ